MGAGFGDMDGSNGMFQGNHASETKDPGTSIMHVPYFKNVRHLFSMLARVQLPNRYLLVDRFG